METEKPINRIQYFAKANRYTTKNFEAACDLKPNVLQNAITRNSNVSDETLRKIMLAFPNLNMKWILAGKGEMLLTKTSEAQKLMYQEPAYSEILQMIEQLGDESKTGPIKERLFLLYQSNSSLKSELLRVYQLIDDI